MDSFNSEEYCTFALLFNWDFGSRSNAKVSLDNCLCDICGVLFSCNLQKRRPVIGIFLQPVKTDAPVVSNLSIPAVSAPQTRLVLFKFPSAISVLFGCEQPGFEQVCLLYVFSKHCSRVFRLLLIVAVIVLPNCIGTVMSTVAQI